jgi:hypothetical protein
VQPRRSSAEWRDVTATVHHGNTKMQELQISRSAANTKHSDSPIPPTGVTCNTSRCNATPDQTARGSCRATGYEPLVPSRGQRPRITSYSWLEVARALGLVPMPRLALCWFAMKGCCKLPTMYSQECRTLRAPCEAVIRDGSLSVSRGLSNNPGFPSTASL